MAPLKEVQERCWKEFARTLPRGARVLDLGTGDGAVLKIIQAIRRDLRLTGVDSAASLPHAPKAIELRAGVKIEVLPFPNSRFGAITSQFGYEYGETRLAAAELRRVLAQGGRGRLIIHYSDGIIVRHNTARCAAIRWAIAEERILERAAPIIRARMAAILPVPKFLNSASTVAQDRFPKQSVAGEIMLGALQAVEVGGTTGLEHLARIGREAEAEIARLEALQRASCDQARIDEVLEELRGVGLNPHPANALVDRWGGPFAWLVDVDG